MSGNDTKNKEKTLRNEGQKCILKLHIEGIILMAVLMVCLTGCLSIITFTVLEIFGIDVFELFAPLSEIIGIPVEITGVTSIAGKIIKAKRVLDYVIAIGGLAGAVILLINMKNCAKAYTKLDTPATNTIKTKKIAYALWGFLLGAYGAHYFYIGKKKRGFINLIVGVLGTFVGSFFVLLLYTMGISFADAYLACFLKKDEEGYISIEDYPYWI